MASNKAREDIKADVMGIMRRNGVICFDTDEMFSEEDNEAVIGKDQPEIIEEEGGI